jgi:hypothetical protein
MIPAAGWLPEHLKQGSDIVQWPLPATHHVEYRDGGEIVRTVPADLVVRSIGGTYASIAGGRNADAEAAMVVTLSVPIAFSVLLVDRTELEGTSWSRCGSRPVSDFTPCKPRPFSDDG